jgi:hypothetical protein
MHDLPARAICSRVARAARLFRQCCASMLSLRAEGVQERPYIQKECGSATRSRFRWAFQHSICSRARYGPG